MCPPCARAARRPGRHRAHACTGGGRAGSIGYSCGCECNRPGPDYDPPIMALDGMPTLTEGVEPSPPRFVVFWRLSDVDVRGNVRPVAVATLGEPRRPRCGYCGPGYRLGDEGCRHGAFFAIPPCTNLPCCTAPEHILACPSPTRRQEADRP